MMFKSLEPAVSHRCMQADTLIIHSNHPKLDNSKLKQLFV